MKRINNTILTPFGRAPPVGALWVRKDCPLQTAPDCSDSRFCRCLFYCHNAGRMLRRPVLSLRFRAIP